MALSIKYLVPAVGVSRLLSTVIVSGSMIAVTAGNVLTGNVSINGVYINCVLSPGCKVTDPTISLPVGIRNRICVIPFLRFPYCPYWSIRAGQESTVPFLTSLITVSCGFNKVNTPLVYNSL